MILITGSNGGIGSELAKDLLESGFKNIVCQYNRSNENILKVLKDHDLSANHLFQANLTREDEVKKLHAEIKDRFPEGISCLLNIAGGSSNSVSWKMTTEDFKKVIDLNLLSTFLTCKEFIPEMRTKNYGRIINVSSVVAFTGVVGASHYCAAKAGIVGFSKALSLELINKNITVNTLALGYFNTGLIHEVPQQLQETIKGNIPSRRFGTTKEIGALIKYLLSEDASYTTGQVHHINGGLY